MSCLCVRVCTAVWWLQEETRWFRASQTVWTESSLRRPLRLVTVMFSSHISIFRINCDAENVCFSEHEAEADCQQHHSGASVQRLDRRLHPSITGEDNFRADELLITQKRIVFSVAFLRTMLRSNFFWCFLICRAPSNRCGFQNKSMKKEENSVLKGNVPDLVFFLNIWSWLTISSAMTEIPTAVFLYIF